MTEKFFHAIINSSSEFPPQLRSVCHCLYQVCLQWLPVSKLWGLFFSTLTASSGNGCTVGTTERLLSEVW